MTVIYTFAEVAEMTKGVIRKDWLDRNARDGKFEHVHVGRMRGVTPAQLEKLLAQQTVKPSAPPPAAPDLPAVDVPSVTRRSRAHHSRRAS